MTALNEREGGITRDLLTRFQMSLVSELGLSFKSVEAYLSDLNRLSIWLERENIHASTVMTSDLRRYLFLDHRFAPTTIARKLSAFRSFFGKLFLWKIRQDQPTEGIEAPHVPAPLPKYLSEEETQRLLNLPGAEHKALLCRDRAMLELLYATGVRVSELIAINLQDFVPHEGVLRVVGKGGYHRMVPLSDASKQWITAYIGRFRRAKKSHQAPLFVTCRGQRLTRQALWKRIKHHALARGLQADQLSPHVLRHACATHLMNHGADLRVVQMILGHRQLSTTQIYTHVAQAQLVALHQAHHLRETTTASSEALDKATDKTHLQP